MTIHSTPYVTSLYNALMKVGRVEVYKFTQIKFDQYLHERNITAKVTPKILSQSNKRKDIDYYIYEISKWASRKQS